MSELAKLYEVLKSATIAEVLAFAALLLPGLVALRAYEAKRGGETRKTNEVLVDIVGYSLIADVIGETLLSAANTLPQPYRVFERNVKDGLDLAAVITLRDGRRIAGRLADPAYVSTYPAAEQLMLGELWRLDQEKGTFIERMRGSWGLLVDKADCETIEFVRWSEIEAGLAAEGADIGVAR